MLRKLEQGNQVADVVFVCAFIQRWQRGCYDAWETPNFSLLPVVKGYCCSYVDSDEEDKSDDEDVLCHFLVQFGDVYLLLIPRTNVFLLSCGHDF